MYNFKYYRFIITSLDRFIGEIDLFIKKTSEMEDNASYTILSRISFDIEHSYKYFFIKKQIDRINCELILERGYITINITSITYLGRNKHKTLVEHNLFDEITANNTNQR